MKDKAEDAYENMKEKAVDAYENMKEKINGISVCTIVMFFMQKYILYSFVFKMAYFYFQENGHKD
jgi:hypothetical protein